MYRSFLQSSQTLFSIRLDWCNGNILFTVLGYRTRNTLASSWRSSYVGRPSGRRFAAKLSVLALIAGWKVKFSSACRAWGFGRRYVRGTPLRTATASVMSSLNISMSTVELLGDSSTCSKRSRAKARLLDASAWMCWSAAAGDSHPRRRARRTIALSTSLRTCNQ